MATKASNSDARHISAENVPSSAVHRKLSVTGTLFPVDDTACNKRGQPTIFDFA